MESVLDDISNPTTVIDDGHTDNTQMAVLKETNQRLKQKLIELLKVMESNSAHSKLSGGKSDNSSIEIYKTMITQRDETIYKLSVKLQEIQDI